MEIKPLETTPFSWGEILLHLDASEELKASFESIKQIIPKDLNFYKYQLYVETAKHERGKYFGLIQREYESTKDIRTELDNKFKTEISGKREYRAQTVAFYEASLALVAERERLFSLSMEYAGFLSFIISIQQRKLDEFYAKGIKEVLDAERLEQVSDKTAELQVMLNEIGMNKELIKEKVEKLHLEVAASRAKNEGYNLELDIRQQFEDAAKAYDFISQRNRKDEQPSINGVCKALVIRRADSIKAIKRLVKLGCVKVNKHGKRKLLQAIRRPQSSDFVDSVPEKTSSESQSISKPEREKTSKGEEMVESTVPYVSEGVIRGEETGEVPDEQPEEDTNPGEEFGRT